MVMSRGLNVKRFTSTDCLRMYLFHFPFVKVHAADRLLADTERKMSLRRSDMTTVADVDASAKTIARSKCTERRAKCAGVRA
jgi:hypothetical protein